MQFHMHPGVGCQHSLKTLKQERQAKHAGNIFLSSPSLSSLPTSKLLSSVYQPCLPQSIIYQGCALHQPSCPYLGGGVAALLKIYLSTLLSGERRALSFSLSLGRCLGRQRLLDAWAELEAGGRASTGVRQGRGREALKRNKQGSETRQRLALGRAGAGSSCLMVGGAARQAVWQHEAPWACVLCQEIL